MKINLIKYMHTIAFFVFLIAFIIFIYVLIYDATHEDTVAAKTFEDKVWISIFFMLIVGCLLISTFILTQTNNTIEKSKVGKSINKILNDKFGSAFSDFMGKKYI